MKNLTIFTASATRPNLLVNAADDRIESPAGWSISAENPEDIIHGFSQLKIKKEYKLRGYQYFSGGNGNGIVWAIPASEELPHPDFCDRLDEMFLGPPKPEIALADFMGAIEGDRSPLSYLQAAIAWHELHEFGAMWHGCSWGQDRILPFTDDYKEEMLSEIDDPDADSSIEDYLNFIHPWDELKEIPAILNPHFFYQKGKPTVVFYTINDIGYYKLSRYIHTFEKESYIQMVQRQEIGAGDGGIIF
ncbi:hypothetical protein [Cytobacillus pseudoceanisediminis]